MFLSLLPTAYGPNDPDFHLGPLIPLLSLPQPSAPGTHPAEMVPWALALWNILPLDARMALFPFMPQLKHHLI